MDFDGAIVLFDGLAVVTRAEVSISLQHDDETLCHSVAARRPELVARKVMRTYSFLAFFCLDAPASTRSARLTALAWTSSSFSDVFGELVPPDLAFCFWLCLGVITVITLFCFIFSKFKGDC